MKFKKQKGQAFSTFQLLIAAVVALAILGILLPMISKNINIGGSPIQAAQTKIKEQMNNPGNLVYTDDVKFSSKREQYISNDAIVKGTGLDSKQVVFSTNGYTNHFATVGGTEETEGRKLEVKSPNMVKYKIGILCNDTLELLIADITDYGLNANTVGHDISIDNISDLINGDGDGDPSAVTCVIFPSKV